MQTEVKKLETLLVAKGVLSAEQFAGHYADYQTTQQEALGSLAERRCWINPEGVLVIESYPSGKILAEIPLLDNDGGAAISASSEFQFEFALVHPEHGRPLTYKRLKSSQPLGLLIGEKTPPLLHYPDFACSAYLPVSRGFSQAYTQRNQSDHFDLVLSPDQDLLLIFHRESGELLLVSLESLELEEAFEIVPGGSEKPLNIAFDSAKQKAYITDNLSSKLHIIELDDFAYSNWVSGLGTLGSLWVVSDKEELYLEIIKPTFSLLYFDLKKMQAMYSVDVEGQSACVLGALAQDFMIASPSQKHLLFVTALQETPFKAQINLINVEDVRAIKSYPLMAKQAPDLIVFGERNPITKIMNASFESYLQEQKIVTAENLEALQEALPEPAMAAARPKKMPAGKFKVHSPPKPQQNILELIGQDGPLVTLPADADEMIVRLIIGQFYQATLTNLEVHETELFRLRKVAPQIRKQLNRKLAIMASVPAVLGKYNFETPISRQMVTEMLEQQLKNPGLPFKMNLCPECRFPLEEPDGYAACPSCEYFLDSAEEAAWRAQVSAECSSFLPAGQFLISVGNKALIFNPWRQLLRVLDGKNSWVQELRDTIVMPDHSFLMTDRKGKKVTACNTESKRTWKATLPLSGPQQASFYLKDEETHFLIVDANKVMEIDRKGKLLREYPDRRTAPEQRLEMPIDLQRTPENHWLIVDAGNQRVIEIDAQNQFLRSFGPEENIQQPLYARRIPQQKTLIVDQASQQVVLIDADNQQQRISYWPLNEELAVDKAPPERVSRLHNGDLLFWGADYYFAFDLSARRARYFELIPAQLNEGQSLVRLQVFNKQSRSIDKQKQIETFIETLKQVECFGEISDNYLRVLAEALIPVRHKLGDLLIPDLGVGHTLYFIAEGEVQIFKNETLLETLGPGDFVGAIALLLSGGELNASVRVSQDSRLLQLDRSAFQRVMVRFSQVFHLLRKEAVERQNTVRRFLDTQTQQATEQLNRQIMENKARRHPLLKEGNDDFFKALGESMRPVAYMPNEDVYGRGESGDMLYLINQGQAGELRKGERSPSVLLGDGDVFGEGSVLFDRRRESTLQTQGYCLLYELEKKDFDRIAEQHSWFREKLTAIIDKKDQGYQEWLASFAPKMGIARLDLPQAQLWSPLEIREDELVYFPTVLMDRVLGISNEGEILWACGAEPGHQYLQPYRSAVKNEQLYITDTGNQRVVSVDLETRQPSQVFVNQTQGLEQPRSATLTHQGELLIADAGDSRLLILNADDQEVWSFEAPHEIMSPFYAEMTDNGTILFTDTGLHKVYEINREGEVLWSYGQILSAGSGSGELNEPAYAHRLSNGETLIADMANDRLLLVNKEGQESAVFYGTAEQPLLQPKHCQICDNGDILVFSGREESVIRLDQWGTPIWSVHLTPPVVQEQTVVNQEESWGAALEAPEPTSDKTMIMEGASEKWAALGLDAKQLGLRETKPEPEPEAWAAILDESEAVTDKNLSQDGDHEHWAGLGLDSQEPQAKREPEAEPEAESENWSSIFDPLEPVPEETVALDAPGERWTGLGLDSLEPQAKREPEPERETWSSIFDEPEPVLAETPVMDEATERWAGLGLDSQASQAQTETETDSDAESWSVITDETLQQRSANAPAKEQSMPEKWTGFAPEQEAFLSGRSRSLSQAQAEPAPTEEMPQHNSESTPEPELMPDSSASKAALNQPEDLRESSPWGDLGL